MGFANIPSPNPDNAVRNKGTYSEPQTSATLLTAMNSPFYITNLVVSTEVAGWIQLITDNPEAEDEIIPKIFLGDNASGGPIYTTPVLVPIGCNVCVASSIAGNHSVMVNGYIS